MDEASQDQEPRKMPESAEELEDLLNQARLDGFRLAGNTAAHLINGQLANPMAIVSWAQGQPNKPDYINPQAAISAINTISETFEKMQKVGKLVPVEGYPDIINLENSGPQPTSERK